MLIFVELDSTAMNKDFYFVIEYNSTGMNILFFVIT